MRVIYVAVVEVETKRDFDTEAALKLLADHQPTFGVSDRGWVEVGLRFGATGLAHACTKAAALARAATGAEAIACEVMTQEEHRARHGGVVPEGEVSGRHAALESRTWLPRQALEPWDRVERPPGRHSS